MPDFHRPSLTLHYEDTGEGMPALLFLHGWCDASTSWGDTVATLSASYRCVAPDMRGHGRSSLPTDHAYFPEALAGDAVALCLSLGIEHPVIVGHSFGGFLAAEIARRFPGFARAVVVVDQPLALEGFQAMVAPMEEAIRSTDGHMAFRRAMFESMITAAMPPGGREIVLRSTEETPVAVAQALWAMLFESSVDELKERGRADIEALGRQPALLLDGEESDGYYDLVRSLAPTVQTRVLNCGHWVHMERPLEFQASLTQFLKDL